MRGTTTSRVKGIPKKYQVPVFLGVFLAVLVTAVALSGFYNSKESKRKRSDFQISFDPSHEESFPAAKSVVGGDSTSPDEYDNDFINLCRYRSFINVDVSVINMDFAAGTYKLKLDFFPCGDYVDKTNPHIGKSTVLGVPVKLSFDNKIYNFTSGGPMNTQEFTASFDSGDINNYPVDRYTATDLFIEAEVTNKNATAPLQVPLLVTFSASLLTYTVKLIALQDFLSPNNPSYETIVLAFKASRAITTIFFSGLIMTIMWGLSLLAVFLAITLWLRGRKVEPPTIAFSIALMFALPNIRNTQPGSPPVGCTADVVSYFWAMVLSAITAGLLLVNYIVKYNYDPALDPPSPASASEKKELSEQHAFLGDANPQNSTRTIV
ncbi:hypothetical protein HDU97_007558 [Phlyctochytrium planicorne]|nr:hypothetical protein HDU97_007558 [Phlyctochytrium planicorne]